MTYRALLERCAPYIDGRVTAFSHETDREALTRTRSELLRDIAAYLAPPEQASREGELVAALESLETVTRSYLQYPLKGEEPGYDAKDVLAYCDEALAALAQGKKE